MVLLLWNFFAVCVSYLSVMLYCLYLTALWSSVGEALGSLVCGSFLCFCPFPIWCPVSGVVFDCIDS